MIYVALVLFTLCLIGYEAYHGNWWKALYWLGALFINIAIWRMK